MAPWAGGSVAIVQMWKGRSKELKGYVEMAYLSCKASEHRVDNNMPTY